MHMAQYSNWFIPEVKVTFFVDWLRVRQQCVRGFG